MQVSSRVYQSSGPPGTGVMGANVYLLVGDGLTLVDAGFRRWAGRVLGGIRRLGYSPSDIERIAITHHHAGHAGSLAPLHRLWSTGSQCIMVSRGYSGRLRTRCSVRLSGEEPQESWAS